MGILALICNFFIGRNIHLQRLNVNSKLTLYLTTLFFVLITQGGWSITHAQEESRLSVTALHTKYSMLQDQLRHNQFNKPIFLDSKEKSRSVTGEIYARIDHPFAITSAALNSPAHWCDIMMLHLNTKYCHASSGPGGTVLNLNIGKKHDQPLDETYRMDFTYYPTTKNQNYLQINLSAAHGPLSTYNYKIMLEATPIENDKTFIHLSYSYGYGFAGHLAMQIYLNTVGSSKVGFTIVDNTENPVYISGMRGVIERNTMRYYLAIEAFLGALSTTPEAQLEKRLVDWFTATERYPRQLYEIKQNSYLEMKRKEHLRQQTISPASPVMDVHPPS